MFTQPRYHASFALSLRVAFSATSVSVGARFLDLKEELQWELSSQIGDAPVNSRSGNVKVKDNVLDAIVGVRGHVNKLSTVLCAVVYLHLLYLSNETRSLMNIL